MTDREHNDLFLSMEEAHEERAGIMADSGIQDPEALRADLHRHEVASVMRMFYPKTSEALAHKKAGEKMNIGTEVMLRYLQSWGHTADEKIATLNKAVAACGIKAEFSQETGGRNPSWNGETKADIDMAIEFRKRLHGVWCGEFNQEARNVEALISEFQRRIGKAANEELSGRGRKRPKGHA